MTQENVTTSLKNFNCEIPQKVYKSSTGENYRIKVKVEAVILKLYNSDSKEYLCVIVQDCVEASIYSYIYMSDHFNTLELKKRAISQSNSILVKHNVKIIDLVFIIE
jgi:hypothetical protein